MREGDAVPEWALDQVRGRLNHGEEIINAVALRSGTRRFVLLNTSRGAALVVKRIVGDPDSVMLAFPKDLLTYRCTSCASRNVVIDVTPPADVHCTHCGHAQHLVRAGEVRTPAAVGQNGKGKATKRAGAAKRGTSKRASTKRTTTRKTATRKTTKKATTKKSAAAARKAPATRKTPTKAKPGPGDKGYRPQCVAITPERAQCRNSARKGSKYCGSHKGYQPPAAKRAGKARDTIPRVKGARDTAPRGRKRATATAT